MATKLMLLAMEHECPFCRARVGEQCKTVKPTSGYRPPGVPISIPHVERADLARQAQGGK